MPETDLRRCLIENRHLKSILAIARDSLREQLQQTTDPELRAALGWALHLLKDTDHYEH